MLRFLCSRCLRLWVADAVAHRGTCPYCGGPLDETPR
jgi:DNA-directed RNA polymerase subunit RPC12/RpoP